MLAAAIILAAGCSVRFGAPKQLARWGDKSFIEQAVDTTLASQATPVLAVLGAGADACRAVLGARPVQVVVNERWAEGQSSSMQAGLAALPPEADSALFLPVDLPGITPQLINAVIERYRQTSAPLVWPEHQGRRGHPVLFARTLFPELYQIRGDTGGRLLFATYGAQAERVAVDSPAIWQDVDTPTDYERLHARSASKRPAPGGAGLFEVYSVVLA
jgi:molybdenum cofactor cytidylyltransferase